MHYTPALRGALDAAQQGELAGRLHADGLFTREVEALSLLHLVRQFPVLLAELEALEASCIATAHAILRHLDPATRRVFEEEGLRAAAAVGGELEVLRLGEVHLPTRGFQKQDGGAPLAFKATTPQEAATLTTGVARTLTFLAISSES